MTDLDLSTELARLHQRMYAVGKREFVAWCEHRDMAERGRVPFRFSLLSWSNWWRYELQVRGGPALLGRNRSRYIMALIDVRGAYEYGNVQCVEVASVLLPAGRVKCRRGQHLRVRGEGHPRSRPVMTPRGRFGSLREAAEANGVKPSTACWRIKNGVDGWTYAQRSVDAHDQVM